jgi:hypothetical protein
MYHTCTHAYMHIHACIHTIHTRRNQTSTLSQRCLPHATQSTSPRDATPLQQLLAPPVSGLSPVSASMQASSTTLMSSSLIVFDVVPYCLRHRALIEPQPQSLSSACTYSTAEELGDAEDMNCLRYRALIEPQPQSLSSAYKL